MRQEVERLCRRAADLREFAHPIDLFAGLDGEAAPELPRLAALVCAAPLDAALHDAFGNVNGIATYDGYGPDHCAFDLSRYLGEEYRGRYVRDFLRRTPLPRVVIAHTVGGLDPLRASDVSADAADDGLPHALEGWIARDGVRAFKVKLLGRDLGWDLDRLIAVHRVAREAVGDATAPIHLSVDLNEQCVSAEYPDAYLRRLREIAPETYAALSYVEQLAPRDLGDDAFDLSAVSALKPVVLDEGLTSIAALDRAEALGWSGIALKTCKCQSLMLLALARATEAAMLVTVQDLSNPGLALLQSVGLAARMTSPSPLEANARQYFPEASAPEAAIHPGVFGVHNGTVSTEALSGSGLGYRFGDVRRGK